MTPEAGWYDDPEVADQERYWDGSAWTPQARDRTVPAASRPPRAATHEPAGQEHDASPPTPPPTRVPVARGRRSGVLAIMAGAVLLASAAGGFVLAPLSRSSAETVAAEDAHLAGGDPTPQASSSSVTPSTDVTPDPPAVSARPPTPSPSGRATSDSLSGAVPVASGGSVERRGEEWVVGDTSGWDPDALLNALVGVNPEGLEFVFFYDRGTLLGTDTYEPSRNITIGRIDDMTFEATYALYDPGQSRAAPSGQRALVTYVLTSTGLEPQDPIPPADPSSPGSRL